LRRARGLTPLTGREAELGRLKEAWQRARAGAGQCVGIVADAGIGKSRLAYEFLTSETVAGCDVIEVGTFESDAVSSFNLIKKLLRTIVAIEDGDKVADAAAKAVTFIESIGGGPSLRSPVLFALDIPVEDREWGSLAPPEHVRRVRDAITILVVLMAKTRPLIILIEDLHWIDSDSKAVLERLIDGIANQRILLLMTFRPEYNHTWASKSNYSQLRLEPLPRGQAESLLKAMLGDDASVRGLVPLIAERTDGVPLFIEETVQSLKQSGAFRPDGPPRSSVIRRAASRKWSKA
jgi:predicted ATPase